MRHQYRNSGFTLIELLVAMAVLSIVLGIAVPSFQSQILNNRSVALGEDFAAAINFVRSEAVKRGKRVSLCASVDTTSCSGVSSDWVKGFIAVVDHAETDKEASPVLTNAANPESTILRVWKKQDALALITIKRGAPIAFIRYNGLGTLARISDENITIESEFKNCKGDAARLITVGLSGLLEIGRKPCTAY